MTTHQDQNNSIYSSVRMGACLVGGQDSVDPQLWLSAYRTFSGQNLVSNRDVAEWFMNISEQAKKAAALASTLPTNSLEELQSALATISTALSSTTSS